MEVWQHKQLKSIEHFCDAVERLPQGESLFVQYTSDGIGMDTVEKFKRAFPWHYSDTQRSYTQDKLRKHGSRGKTNDFAYANRAMCYFGYDQFVEHRQKPNKLICLWDPSLIGDNFGEHNPCLVMVKFKRREKYLDMVAIFRKRDLCRRMIGNMVFLSLWLNENAVLWKLKPGQITDVSMETQWKKEDLKKLQKEK